MHYTTSQCYNSLCKRELSSILSIHETLLEILRRWIITLIIAILNNKNTSVKTADGQCLVKILHQCLWSDITTVQFTLQSLFHQTNLQKQGTTKWVHDVLAYNHSNQIQMPHPKLKSQMYRYNSYPSICKNIKYMNIMIQGINL